MSVQNKFLGDVPESPFDRLNHDRSSIPVLSFPHSNSKHEEPVGVCLWCPGGGLWVIQGTVCSPRFPIAVPVGPVHSGSANCFPRRVSKTLNFTQGRVDASIHGWEYGREKAMSKAEQKAESDSAFWE